jgi:hypothetical protein
MMNAPGATENACTRGVVYTLVDFTLTFESPVLSYRLQLCSAFLPEADIVEFILDSILREFVNLICVEMIDHTRVSKVRSKKPV